MKGALGSPFLLQAVILFFGGFYLLGLCSQYSTYAITNCRYDQNGYTEDATTNNQYSILCSGNSVTAGIFGFTALITLAGSLAAIVERDVDSMLSFVFCGVISGYTADAFTNLRVNCVAGDTSSQNPFDDNVFDSADERCKSYTYTAIAGLVGVMAALAAAYYAVRMKQDGKFYPQRPIFIFIGMSGMAMLFSFSYMGVFVTTCHYYQNGKGLIGLYPPAAHLDDLVYDQLDPLCEGYKNASIVSGVAAILSLVGIPLLAFIKKTAMWVNILWFTCFISAANIAAYEGSKISICEQYRPPSNGDAKNNSLDMLCDGYSTAYYLSILGSAASVTALLLTILILYFKIDHDSLITRLRRSVSFVFIFTYIGSLAFIATGNMTSNCDVYGGNINDDAKAANTDDVVLNNSCKGLVVQVFFFMISLFGVSVAVAMSLYFNFPLDGAPIQEEVAEGTRPYRIDAKVSNEPRRLASRDTPVASSFFRSSSYFYEENWVAEKDLEDSPSLSGELQRGLLHSK